MMIEFEKIKPVSDAVVGGGKGRCPSRFSNICTGLVVVLLPIGAIIWTMWMLK